MNEIRAMNAKRTGYLPPADTYVEVKPSGPKEKKPLKRSRPTKRDNAKEIEAYFATVEAEHAGDCQCWECGSLVPDKFIRFATAHIFPKSDFESVAAHPSNYIILGAHCCHDKSHRVDLFCKMGIWKEAVERFLIFEYLLTAEEKAKKYYTLFREAAMASFPALFPESITHQLLTNA
ncbi:MAG TPA: hypothetical protein VGN00_14045 [Puia sp.]